MADHCEVCPALQQQIAELHTQVMMLASGIKAVQAFIDKELEEPTMPAKPPRNGKHKGPTLIGSVQTRLGNTLDSAH